CPSVSHRRSHDDIHRRRLRTPYRPERIAGPRRPDPGRIETNDLQPHQRRPPADDPHARRIAARPARFRSRRRARIPRWRALADYRTARTASLERHMPTRLPYTLARRLIVAAWTACCVFSAAVPA